MTGNDDNREKRRNPWGQADEGPSGPWGRPQPNRNAPEGPDFEDIIRQAKMIFGNRPNAGGHFGLIALLVVLGVWLSTGVYRVDPGENAVIKRFGAIMRTQVQPGLGVHLPWPFETATKLNVMLDRRTSIGFQDQSRQRDVAEESLMLTADANIVDIDVVVLWNVIEAEKFLFAIRNPEQTIKRVAESAIRETVGQTRLQSIITDSRDDVAVQIQKTMQSILDFYNSGVSVKQVLIQEATVHPEVLAAYNDVAASRQDAERYQNEATIYRNDIIPKARGEAIKMKQEAEAYKQDVIARAKGDADRFTEILAGYRSGKDVTRDRIYIETMENVLKNANRVILDQKDGAQGAIPILPLDMKRVTTSQDVQ